MHGSRVLKGQALKDQVLKGQVLSGGEGLWSRNPCPILTRGLLRIDLVLSEEGDLLVGCRRGAGAGVTGGHSHPL